MLFINNVMM